MKVLERTEAQDGLNARTALGEIQEEGDEYETSSIYRDPA